MSDYPLSLVEKLSFVRYGGTFEEARARRSSSTSSPPPAVTAS